MTALLRKVRNVHHIAVSRDSFYDAAGKPALARELTSKLMASPKPEPDEWGLAPYREIWVQFTLEGVEPRELGEEEPEPSQQWINAFSLISPSDRFLEDYQKGLESELKYLFEGDELIAKKDELLFRIVAS